MIDALLRAWHTVVLLTSTICVVLIGINTTVPVAVVLGSMALANDQFYRLIARARRRALDAQRTRWVVPFRVPTS